MVYYLHPDTLKWVDRLSLILFYTNYDFQFPISESLIRKFYPQNSCKTFSCFLNYLQKPPIFSIHHIHAAYSVFRQLFLLRMKFHPLPQSKRITAPQARPHLLHQLPLFLRVKFHGRIGRRAGNVVSPVMDTQIAPVVN